MSLCLFSVSVHRMTLSRRSALVKPERSEKSVEIKTRDFNMPELLVNDVDSAHRNTNAFVFSQESDCFSVYREIQLKREVCETMEKHHNSIKTGKLNSIILRLVDQTTLFTDKNC